MTVSFRPLHPLFFAEVTRDGKPLDLRQVHDQETLTELRDGMDKYGVLVFPQQPFTNAEQLAFAQRWDGALHAKLGSNVVDKKTRLGSPALCDTSNLGMDGKIRSREDRHRLYSLANRLWHTDASFRVPAGRYSLLSARIIPKVRADTEFADMYAAYDALDAATKQQIDKLQAHHSIAYSRQTLGFTFSEPELDNLRGAVQPLVRTNPRTGRKSLYIASHANSIIDWPLPEARLLLLDLMTHATQPQFCYSHDWRDGDMVVWDNLATMHRGRPYDDINHKRELVRVTTLDADHVPGSEAKVLDDLALV